MEHRTQLAHVPEEEPSEVSLQRGPWILTLQFLGLFDAIMMGCGFAVDEFEYDSLLAKSSSCLIETG